ncbi:MAG: Rrf2 family transcriptional regulator [Lachnospiraceae bacterium]|nr:Rrf2 family transcriptional regulator [Lachnospiraceae bacterium]
MISTKGRYSIRVMLDLAMQEPNRYIPLKDIAARQGLSDKYLEIVLKVLVKEKLLKGLRGKGGGYQLTRAPEDYTIGEILMLSEGNLSSVACLAPGAETCERAAQCITLPMWQKFNTMVHDYFFGITLADLIAQSQNQQKKNQKEES